MPFKSKAQQRKFFADPELRQYAKEFAQSTNFSKIPERIKQLKKKRTVQKVESTSKFAAFYLKCLSEANSSS